MRVEKIFTRTRIAPTPSGFLHLGNVFSFALTVSLARRTGAKLLLRIDDMDKDRVDRAYVQDIFDTLNFMELPWDEGPRDTEAFEREYSQHQRMDMYREGLRELKESCRLFACSCSRAQILRQNPEGVYPGTCREKGIPLDAENVSWRLRTNEEKLSVKVLQGGNVTQQSFFTGVEHALLPPEMRDFVIRKKDGYPAYQLTSVLDDLFYEVDLIVRGADLWPSTLAQQYLSSIINTQFGGISFYHHPLLMASSGQKLSKSAGDTSIRYLRQQGHKAEDVYSRLGALLGIVYPVRNWLELAEAVGNQIP